MIPETNLLFVFGYPKSGTTYLQTILDNHPAIMCTQEGAFHEFGKALADPVRVYNERLQIKGRIFGQPAYPSFDQAEYKVLLRTFIKTRLMTKAKNLSDQELDWLGDKDPDHGRYIATLGDLFPGASYIHIVRDCRDVAISWWHHMHRVAPHITHPEFEESCLQTGELWREYVENVHKVVAEKELRCHELRYEDLLANPEGETERVLAFLAAANGGGIVSRSVDAARFERLNGGRERGVEDTGSFFRKGVVGDWQNKMNNELERRVVDKAGPLMSKLGYA